MPRGKKTLTIKVTHRYVADPEAVDRAMKIWASMLAEAIKRKALEQARAAREGGEPA